MLRESEVPSDHEEIGLGAPTHLYCILQVTKYVLREILNHRSLVHPHIVQFKEVINAAAQF